MAGGTINQASWPRQRDGAIARKEAKTMALFGNMFLAIDVGNTQTTLGLIDAEGAVLEQWHMATNADDTADELVGRLYSFFAVRGLDLKQSVDSAGIACVVPLIVRSWRGALAQIGIVEPKVVDAVDQTLIDIHMPNPKQVGADRIANAAAAVKRWGAPVIVVDFGTATNIDVVDTAGAYSGGAIAPGLMLSAKALFARAAKLSNTPIVAPESALGYDTETAIQSGIVIGAAAMAEGLVSRIREAIGAPDAPCIATGGLATVVAKATDVFDAVDRDITLEGIWLLAQEQ
jgi:type III pantothenate kinase